MSKYKIYDTKEKRFLELHEAAISNEGNVITFKSGAIYDVAINSTRYTIHYYISKTDINSNKIYADCSIVEFEYCFEDYGWQDYEGFFYFDRDELSYKLKCCETNGDIIKVNMTFNQSRIKNLKIIDTIQENKLGLIKKFKNNK